MSRSSVRADGTAPHVSPVVSPSLPEQISYLCPKECPHIVFQAVSGPLAAATASVLTNPMDVIRTRVQVRPASLLPVRRVTCAPQCSPDLSVSRPSSPASQAPSLCLRLTMCSRQRSPLKRLERSPHHVCPLARPRACPAMPHWLLPASHPGSTADAFLYRDGALGGAVQRS